MAVPERGAEAPRRRLIPTGAPHGALRRAPDGPGATQVAQVNRRLEVNQMLAMIEPMGWALAAAFVVFAFVMVMLEKELHQ